MKRSANRLAIYCAFGFLAIGSSSIAFAQGEIQSESKEVQMSVITNDQDGVPMIFSTTENFTDGVSSGIQVTPAGPGTIMLSGDATNKFGLRQSAPNPWSMLNHPSVQKDLELVGDQQKKLEDLQTELARNMREQMADFPKGKFDAAWMKEFRDRTKQLQADHQESIRDLLLPHQIDRLKQIALQTHLKRAGTAGVLASKKIAEKLGITAEQQESLKKRSKKINEKLAKDIQQLKEKARDDLLKVLTLEQRNKLEDLIGDKYEPQAKDMAEQFRSFRRRGGTAAAAP